MAGRPKKSKVERRTKTVFVRVSSAEKRAFTQAARKVGTGVSTWLRMLATREAGSAS